MRGTLASSAYLQTRSVTASTPFWALTSDDGGFDGQQGGAGFVGEHVEAGGVDEIDL